MSAKADDNATSIEVPEASPDVNNSKQEAPAAPTRRMLWLGLAAVALVAVTVGITVPLVKKSNDNKDDSKAEVATEASKLSFEEVQPVECKLDVRPCPDGVNSVGRSGPNCEFNFDECPKAENLPEVVACQLDVRPCPDGVNSVGRSGPNCEFNFDECPKAAQLPEVPKEPVQLPEISEEGHPCNGFSECGPCLNSRMECAWTGGRCEPDCVLADAACYHPRYFPDMIGPEICAIADTTPEVPMVACTMEIKWCADGVTSVGRTGPNCEFEACPGEAPAVACTMEIKWCADGVTSVGRTGPNCDFEACSEEVPAIACTLELKICPDGITSVGRTGPNCEFEACPGE